MASRLERMRPGMPGPVSAMSSAPTGRMATVTAVTRLTCHVIALWDFRRFAKENPDVCWALLEHVAALLAAERERRALAELALLS